MPGSPFDASPFDLLTPLERSQLREAAETIEYAADATLLAPGSEPTHAWLLLTGQVQQLDDAQAPLTCEPGELLALRALLSGRNDSRFTARGAVSTLRLPKPLVQDLIAGNAPFAAALFASLARTLSSESAVRPQRELASLLMSRVRDAYLRKPLVVDGSIGLIALCRLLAEQGRTEALVRDGKRLGLFTTTDLRDALARPEPAAGQVVREAARFEPISVSADAELLEAMLLMLRHRVHRVLVRDGDTVVGVLGQLDLMSFVSNHSHLIALQIEQAASVAELRDAAHQVDRLIEVLHGDGVRIEVISALVRELNRQLFVRLWSLLAGPALRDNSCLLVMGSEGRGEQIIKTDQDNALLLRDGHAFEDLAELTARFSAALEAFGYPPCPGGIMLSRPLWCQPLGGFLDSLREWIHGADPLGPLNLAIFLDASAVAGDATLLGHARDQVDRLLVDSDAFYARFAAAIDQFGEPGGWWSRLAGRRAHGGVEVDLKKLGIFPIVHGARALSLQYRVRELGTAERLHSLVALGHIDEALARDLIDALRFLIGLKLRSNLRQRRLGQLPDNLLRPDSLGTLERDSLADSLAIVRRFRQWLRRHYRLDSL